MIRLKKVAISISKYEGGMGWLASVNRIFEDYPKSFNILVLWEC